MTDMPPVEFDKDGWPERLILSRSHQSEIVEYMQPWGEAEEDDRLYIRADTIAALRAAPVAMRECDHPFCGDKCGSAPLGAPAPVNPVAEAALSERLARCVKPLRWGAFTDDIPPDEQAEYQAQHIATVLAALDMDALAREVEAMVGAEREAIAAWLEAHDYYTAGAERGFSPARFPGMDQHHKAIAAAIRAREGGKP
jgi:hypothetical protein